MIEPFRIFIGYDSREQLAYHVCVHSILSKASIPISITPLALPNLRRIFTRPRGAAESTEFTYSRFLVPYLSGYQGYSLFMDCDMLMRVDILELQLHLLADPNRAVWCCHHDYVPKDATKFLGQVQSTYPRKNWSSFVVFENAKCRALTPDMVNTASGAALHRFQWLDDAQIGRLPLEWNWLVSEYPANDRAKVLHFTNGGPWFEGYADVDHADEWRAMRDDMVEPALREPVAVGHVHPSTPAPMVS